MSNQVLRPILQIPGLSLTDRTQIERLIREADRASEGFIADPSTGVRADLYIERVQRLLTQAQTIMAKYAD